MKRITHSLLSLLLVLLTLVTGRLHADENAPLDFVSQQLASQLLNNIRAQSSPELVQAKARYLRLTYQALIDQGFTKDEALKIVIALAEGEQR